MGVVWEQGYHYHERRRRFVFGQVERSSDENAENLLTIIPFWL
jgi:hypothetical protein